MSCPLVKQLLDVIGVKYVSSTGREQAHNRRGVQPHLFRLPRAADGVGRCTFAALRRMSLRVSKPMSNARWIFAEPLDLLNFAARNNPGSAGGFPASRLRGQYGGHGTVRFSIALVP